MVFGLTRGDRVLVVAPHPDDETLGAGGTIARLAEAGIEVHVLAVTCHSQPGAGAEARRDELAQACEALGVHSHHIAWTGTAAARGPGAHQAALVHLIEAGEHLSIASLRPHALLIPADGSFHQDHRAVHDAGRAAARPCGGARSCPPIVLGYAGPEDAAWGRGSQARTVAVDTSSTWPTKAKALGCYQSQMHPAPHPRSIEAIAARDTAEGSTFGFAKAETFTAYRMAC
ncbi:PIG-L deacetylase family protein [Kitasatospora sp. NPDC086791]|uniref:PIG-L deacetylase family protein n=1 Tax=Kitasatospora sp. NPDC086791 TaxID=3155178 RepID=UPI0034384A61